jgi:hypothetical protein
MTNGTEKDNGKSDHASSAEQFLLVLFLLLTFLALVGLLFLFWPEGKEGSKAWAQSVSLFGVSWGAIGDEVRLFVLVICAGALGAFVHVATSVGEFIGNRGLYRRWVYWYILRLPVGATLSLLFYLLLRGGAVTGSVSSVKEGATMPYGFVGLSALAGMFSDVTVRKLSEVFKLLFPTKEDHRKDTLKESKLSTSPILSQLVPNQIPPVGATVKLIGLNFEPSSLVRVGGQQRKPTYVGPTELSIQLTQNDVAGQSTIAIQVETPNVTNAKAPALSKTLDLGVEK